MNNIHSFIHSLNIWNFPLVLGVQQSVALEEFLKINQKFSEYHSEQIVLSLAYFFPLKTYLQNLQ